MNKIPIVKYSNHFDTFRNQFNGDRQKLIDDEIKEFAKDPLKLPPPKQCDRYNVKRMKILLFEAKVVAFYDDLVTEWKFIDGNEYQPRAG